MASQRPVERGELDQARRHPNRGLLAKEQRRDPLLDNRAEREQDAVGCLRSRRYPGSSGSHRWDRSGRVAAVAEEVDLADAVCQRELGRERGLRQRDRDGHGRGGLIDAGRRLADAEDDEVARDHPCGRGAG